MAKSPWDVPRAARMALAAPSEGQPTPRRRRPIRPAQQLKVRRLGAETSDLRRRLARQAIVDGKKQCSVCGEFKPLDEFPRNKAGGGGRSGQCKICMRVRRDLAGTRDRHLRNTYGITLAKYEWMLESQGGVCAICGEAESATTSRYGTRMSLSVDHDHTTGLLRGLLCSRCNQGISFFMHNRDRLKAAIRYLDATAKQARKGT